MHNNFKEKLIKKIACISKCHIYDTLFALMTLEEHELHKFNSIRFLDRK